MQRGKLKQDIHSQDIEGGQQRPLFRSQPRQVRTSHREICLISSSVSAVLVADIRLDELPPQQDELQAPISKFVPQDS